MGGLQTFDAIISLPMISPNQPFTSENSRQATQGRQCDADSTDRRNTLLKLLCWCLVLPVFSAGMDKCGAVDAFYWCLDLWSWRFAAVS
jgi:hypothetical protein